MGGPAVILNPMEIDLGIVVLLVGACRKVAVRAAFKIVALATDSSRAVAPVVFGYNAPSDAHVAAKALIVNAPASGGRIVGKGAVGNAHVGIDAVEAAAKSAG